MLIAVLSIYRDPTIVPFISKRLLAIQDVCALKNFIYFNRKKLECPVNQERISHIQAVKSTVSAAPIVKEILPAVSQFIER